MLLDPLASGYPAEWLAKLPETVEQCHLRDPMFKEATTSAPLLARFPLAEIEALQGLVDRARAEAIDGTRADRSICMFMQSGMDLGSLSLKLSRLLDLRVASRGIYFRFFDPRTLLHLPQLLPHAQLRAWFEGIDAWAVHAWEGDWTELRTDTLEGTHDAEPYRISASTWNRVQGIEHLCAAVRLLRAHDMPCPPSEAERLFEQVETLRAAGFESPDDVAYGVACQRQQGRRFDQLAGWSSVLTLTRAEVPLADALNECCAIELRSPQNPESIGPT